MTSELKPIEPGCLAVMIAGSQNAGTEVIPIEFLGDVYSYVCDQGITHVYEHPIKDAWRLDRSVKRGVLRRDGSSDYTHNAPICFEKSLMRIDGHEPDIEDLESVIANNPMTQSKAEAIVAARILRRGAKS